MANTKNIDIDQGTTFTDYVRYLDKNNAGISLADYTEALLEETPFYLKE